MKQTFEFNMLTSAAQSIARMCKVILIVLTWAMAVSFHHFPNGRFRYFSSNDTEVNTHVESSAEF